MSKKLIGLTLILALFFRAGLVIAKNGHRITGFEITHSPAKPTKNLPVTTFEINFKLKSSTGITEDRLRFYVNNGAPLNGTLLITRLPEQDDTVNGREFANINFKKPGFAFTKVSNEVRVEYLLSGISDEPPQASKTKIITAKDTSGGGGNDGGDDGGNDSGEDETDGDEVVRIPPRLIRIEITDVNGDGMVSSSPRQFRITAYHDERIVAKVTENGYNTLTDPVISNLKIFEENPNDLSDRTLVTNGFTFSLETPSASAALYDEISNQLKTIFISNGKTITDQMNLIFKVNLNKLAEKSEVTLEEDIKKKSTVRYKIRAQELNFKTLTIENGISFTSTSNKKSKYFFDSASFDITGTFNGSESVSSIDEVEYFKKKTKTTKSKPKLKNSLKKSKRLSAKGENGAASVAGTVNGGYTVTIPTVLSIKSTLRSLTKKGFFNDAIKKEVKIPINVITKTSNGLDLIINGQVLMDSTLIFTNPVVHSGGSL